MTFFVCFAKGMADCTPDEQSYHDFDTVEGLLYAVEQECEMFERDDAESHFWNSDKRETVDPAGRLPIRYQFRVPREGENNYSQRICISRFSDRVLDVIGMTEDDYRRENGED